MATKKKRSPREVVGKVEMPGTDSLSASVEDLIKELVLIAQDNFEKKTITSALSDVFKPVEETNFRVSDVVMDPISFVPARKAEIIDPETKVLPLNKGLFGTLWGARVWVDKSAKEVSAYRENSKLLPKHFPEIAKAKKALLITD